jgi:hypothetical protein
MLYQVGDLFELNVKLRYQKFNVNSLVIVPKNENLATTSDSNILFY